MLIDQLGHTSFYSLAVWFYFQKPLYLIVMDYVFELHMLSLPGQNLFLMSSGYYRDNCLDI